MTGARDTAGVVSRDRADSEERRALVKREREGGGGRGGEGGAAAVRLQKEENGEDEGAGGSCLSIGLACGSAVVRCRAAADATARWTRSVGVAPAARPVAQHVCTEHACSVRWRE